MHVKYPYSADNIWFRILVPGFIPSLVRDGFGAKGPGTIRGKYPNALCCLKAYISHKINHVFNFADFLVVKQELICKQIDDVKMKFGLITQH